MGKGTKRGSPGAEAEKNPLQNVELSEEDAKKLEVLQRDYARAELVIERQAQLKLVPTFEKRRQVLKTIPKFWPVALINHSLFAYHAQHRADQSALSYLEDVWVERDSNEPRCYIIEFHFKENPYFNNKVLKKEYNYITPLAAATEKPDEDGIAPYMLEFSWERDVEIKTMKIDWKEPQKALTKLYPLETSTDEDLAADAGSFFNFFEHRAEPNDLGIAIANEIFPEAIEYFLGNAASEEDITDSEEEEEDDDEEEIDLEKPRPKKRKV
ncbi:hypothetical protein AX16_005631 [Volvariella volvacea WC 439]|nr:hypothetical protein AX16_005631 [Volvariella volvacea WC 439]